MEEQSSEGREASPSITFSRLRRGFLATSALDESEETCEQFAAVDTEDVADLARAWALGAPAEAMGVERETLELRSAAMGVWGAYWAMSRPKGAGAWQLDARIIDLGRALGMESFREAKGPDYGSALTGEEDSGLSEALTPGPSPAATGEGGEASHGV